MGLPLSRKIKMFFAMLIPLSSMLFLFQNATSVRPHFKRAWLEPLSLYNGVVPRTGGTPTKQKLIEVFRKYKEMDIDTVVISYSEMQNYIFYKPKNALIYKEVIADNYMNSSYSGATISSLGSPYVPLNQLKIVDNSILPTVSWIYVTNYGYPPFTGNIPNNVWADPVNENRIPFLDAIFDAAAANNIKIILGLSKFSDKYLVQNLDSYYFTNNGSISQLNERLSKNIEQSKIMVSDLYDRYYVNVRWAKL